MAVFTAQKTPTQHETDDAFPGQTYTFLDHQQSESATFSFNPQQVPIVQVPDFLQKDRSVVYNLYAFQT